MSKVLLSLHVLAAVLAIGPVAVAASMFPAAVRKADGELGTVRLLHRICRIYAVAGVAVPLFGLATASSLGVLGDTWLIISIVLTVVAAGLLAFVILPGQQRLLAGAGARKPLAMTTGLFNLLWAAVTVLMIVRPGSTTGV
ncbi:hypothetical protein [Sciscionella marina]|uniref:hypothetical protein n=1 Tax=Sciscionella marina TaxID=508770 RepID=UPI0003782430|nr:hypothetical protein [Sciscionella marina]